MNAWDRVPIPRAAAADWAALRTPSAPPGLFDASALSGFPEPARRWLTHAVTPGTPAWSTAQVRMHGQIRLGGRWREYTAQQVVAPGRGFVWAATSRLLGVRVTGFDRYNLTRGQMRWRLLGWVPVLSSSGPDVTRSAVGRFAGEAVIVPTACVRATWSEGPEPDTAVMSWNIGGHREDTVLRVDSDGRLREAVLQRWGNPGGTGFGRYPFGVAIEEETLFDGVRTPAVFRAGWWWGTDRQGEGEFFRAHFDEVLFR